MSKDDIKSSNQLRNSNSYEYLKYLANTIPKEWQEKQRGRFAVFGIIFLLSDDTVPYDKSFCYGDLYTSFMQTLEDYVEKNPKDLTIKKLVLAVFVNQNDALLRAHETIVKSIKKYIKRPENIQSVISSDLPDSLARDAKNAITPLRREATTRKFLDAISDDFKPQTTTSQPSIRTYDYRIASDPIELRLGTQAQRHAGQPRVSPLFKQFLNFQQLPDDFFKITHVYFNDLGKDLLPDSNFISRTERENEAAFTHQLEELELKHENIAVITLPSDKGIMAHSYIKDTSLIENPFDKLLAISLGKSVEPVQDFYISDSVREQLFTRNGKYDQGIEESTLSQLLRESFRALGFNSKESYNSLTKAQYQAVWFYFTKFKLTDFILQQLNPLTFQMSCKDGIDRGGAHSAIYNLMKSFEFERKPMRRDEFERAIDAAPTLVKGRGMNDHRERIWNVINFYIKAHSKSLGENSEKNWLLAWHKENTPADILRATKTSYSSHPKSEVTLFKKEKSKPSTETAQAMASDLKIV